MSPLYVFLALLLGLSSARLSRNRHYYDYSTSSTSSTTELPPYWSDYNYYPGAGSWLMLHALPASWGAANDICKDEGAVLASPTTEGLYLEMKNIIDLAKIDVIHTGVNTNVSENVLGEGDYVIDQEDADELNVTSKLSCVSMRSSGLLEDIECDVEHAFICYKASVEAGTGYVRNNETGSSYKFHNTRVTWGQANATCTAEGAHLAIINSNEEARVLLNLHRKFVRTLYSAHIGVYNEGRHNGGVYGEWMTVDGQTLEQVGYTRWWHDRPITEGLAKLCGVIIYRDYYSEAILKNVICSKTSPFICEIDSSLKEPGH